jgi:hypothetical protein
MIAVASRGNNILVVSDKDELAEKLELESWEIFNTDKAATQKLISNALKQKGFGGFERLDFPEQAFLTDIPFPVIGNAENVTAPVTRDDAGNVIPLSQRFNPASNDIRYSVARSQEMGVPNLGNDHLVESRAAIRAAIHDNIFNAESASLTDPDTYQDAHDMARALTGNDKDALRAIQDRLTGHPAMVKAELTGATQLRGLPATLYGELMRYAARLVTEGGHGGQADFSLLTTLARNYRDILGALGELTSDEAASSTTKTAQALSSLKEVSGPFGMFLSYFRDNMEAATAAMKKQGWSQEQIDALDDFLKGEVAKKPMEELLAEKEAELAKLNKALDELRKKAAAAPAPARGKKAGKETESAEDEDAEVDLAAPPKLTLDELKQLPRDVAVAYHAKLDDYLKESGKSLTEAEASLRQSRERFIEQGTDELTRTFLPEPPSPEGLDAKLQAVNREMRGIITEVMQELGIMPEKVSDPDRLFRDMAVKLALPEVTEAKKEIVDGKVQERLMDMAGIPDGTEFDDALAESPWLAEMWEHWNRVAAELDIGTRVAGGSVSRAIYRVMGTDMFPLNTAQILRLGNESFAEVRDQVADAVVAQVRDLTDGPDEASLAALHDQVSRQFNRVMARAAVNRVWQQVKRSERAPRDPSVIEAADKLMATADKPVTVQDIVRAIRTGPADKLRDAAWRRAVITEWLERQRVPSASLKAAELDRVVAGIFAEAQKRMLDGYVNSLKPKDRKPTKGELDKIGEAIRIGWVTGAPVAWQNAFTEKTGIQPLTPVQMQEAMRLESIRTGEGYNLTDKTAAAAKLNSLYRRAHIPPSTAQIVAQGFTQSMLTSAQTETMQFTQAFANMGLRLVEALVSGVFHRHGVSGAVRAMNQAWDAYKASLTSALFNDAYRTHQQEEIQRMSSLKTAWEQSAKKLSEAKGLAKLNPVLWGKLFYQSMDFARRLMSSADDAAVTSMRALIQTADNEKIARDAGMTPAQITRLYEVANLHRTALAAEAAARGYTGGMAKMWVRDEIGKHVNDALAAELVARGDTKEQAQKKLDEAQAFAVQDSDIEVGVGPTRDIGSKLELHWYGEKLIGLFEKGLITKKGDPTWDAAAENMMFRTIFSFMRTTFNFMSRSVYRSPLGLYRLAITANRSDKGRALYARTMGTERQRQQRMREALTWTVAEALLWALVAGLSGKDDDPEDDGIIINGGGPDDAQAKAAWQAAGHSANTIEINTALGKVTIPFGRAGLESLRPGLAIMGAMRDMELNGMAKGTPVSLLELAKNYGGNALYTNNFFGLKNVTNWRSAATNPNRLAGSVAYMLSPLIPWSGAIRSVGRVAMPDRPDASSIQGAILSSTPLFWLAEKGHNLYGTPIYGTPNSAMGSLTKRLMWAIGMPFSIDTGGDERTAEVLAWTTKTGQAPPWPSRSDVDESLLRDNRKHEPLTDEQWGRWAKAAGDNNLAEMKRLVPSLEKMTESALRSTMGDIRDRSFEKGRKASGVK